MNIWDTDPATGLIWREYREKVLKVFPRAAINCESSKINYYYNSAGYSYPNEICRFSVRDYSLESTPIIGTIRADRERAWKSAYLYILKCDPEAFNV